MKKVNVLVLVLCGLILFGCEKEQKSQTTNISVYGTVQNQSGDGLQGIAIDIEIEGVEAVTRIFTQENGSFITRVNDIPYPIPAVRITAKDTAGVYSTSKPVTPKFMYDCGNGFVPENDVAFPAEKIEFVLERVEAIYVESYQWQIQDYTTISREGEPNSWRISDSLALANTKVYKSWIIKGINADSLCAARIQVIPLSEKTIQPVFVRKEGNEQWWEDSESQLYIKREGDSISGNIQVGESNYMFATIAPSEAILIKYKNRPPVEFPEPPIEDTQLAGHWKLYYYYDGKFRLTSMDFERHLWLEADSTFRHYKNDTLVDKGRWSVGHTERYYEMSPLVADKFRDSIVFAGEDTTVVRFFEYPSEKNRYRLQMIFANPIEWPDWCSSPEYWERMEK